MSKELTLVSDGHTWQVEVHQMTLRMSMAAARLSEEAAKKITPETDTTEAVMTGFFYPIMAAVTTCKAGSIPTSDEFLDMPTQVANAWYAAVLELNPEALPKELGGALEVQPEEKKENSPPTSTPG